MQYRHSGFCTTPNSLLGKDYEPRNNLSQYLLVGPRAFHILHPRNVEALLSTNFKGERLQVSKTFMEFIAKFTDPDYEFGCQRAVFAPLLGNGIFTQEGIAWKHSRELLRKQFVRAQYQNLNHFREYVDNFINCMPA